MTNVLIQQKVPPDHAAVRLVKRDNKSMHFFAHHTEGNACIHYMKVHLENMMKKAVPQIILYPHVCLMPNYVAVSVHLQSNYRGMSHCNP